MAKQSHHQAAEHHTKAAQSHKTAAEHHDKGNHAAVSYTHLTLPTNREV